MRYPVFILAITAATVAEAQQSPVAPEILALRTCATHADRGAADSALAFGRKAEVLFRTRVTANPRDVDGLVGLARTLSQCLVPSAGLISQGELSGEAMELLDRAIEQQSDHWMARYVLASIAYRSPSFLGRGKRAAHELEYLLRLQGDRTDNPMQARVFEMRGLQLSREGNADSARALWTRGATLFPADSALRALVARPGNPSPPTPQQPQPDSASSAALATSTLETVRVAVSSGPPPPAFPSVHEVPRSQVVMTAGGTADVLQAVQLLPGTTRVGEGSDIYTRGGDASETSLVLNGGRLLSLARFEGISGSMFGALEPWVVKSVRYSSGGFSARYGNALSGVIDIETDGRPRERQTRAGLSLVQVSATTRLPLGNKVGGWVSGRVSRTGALLAAHGRTDEFQGAPHSEEMIASIVATPSLGSELRATAIVETDDSRRILNAAGWRGPFHSAGNTRGAIVSARWLSPTAPVLVRMSVAGSERSTDWNFGVLSREREEHSVISRVDVDWQAATPATLRVGIEHGTLGRTDRGTLPTTPNVATGAPTRSLADGAARAGQLGAYAETELTRSGATLTLGLRGDRLPGEDETTLDPRAAVSYRAGDWTSRLSAGLFHQGRWRAEGAIPNAGIPTDVPTEARHLVAAVERMGVESTMRVEAYVKQYRDYHEAGSGPRVRAGLARGLDLLAQRNDVGRLSGWVGYSLMDATVTLADGSRAHSPFDVTHSATGSITARLTEDWSLGYTVRYGSGAPMTPIVRTIQDAQGLATPVYGETMSERLPAYGRMDARVMRFMRMPSFLLTTYVEVLNLGNRHNVSGITYDSAYRNREPIHTFFATRTVVVGGEFRFR